MAGDDLFVQDDLTIPAAELQLSTSRASGPGGQHVNTADTRVQLRWNVLESAVLNAGQRDRLARKLASRLSSEGVLMVVCATHRSQHRNREEARERLVDLVREALVKPKPRRRTRIPRGSKEKRLEGKRRTAQTKHRRRKPDEE